MSQLARGGALNLLGALVSSAVNILLVVAVARVVSQSQAGRFFAATSVFLLVVVVSKLGANTGLVYFIARLRALGRPDLIGARLRTALGPVLVVAGVLGSLLWIFADQLAGLVVPDDTSQTASYIRTLGIFVPMAAIADVTLAATRGFRKMRPTVVADLVARPVLQLGLTMLVLAGDSPLPWLALAWAAPYAPELLAACLWLRIVWRREARPATADSAAGFGAGDFWRFTGPRAITSIVQIAMQRLDIILIAALRGPAEAAIYTAATRFLVVGQFGNQAISAVVQPRLSELLAVNDRLGAKAIYQAATAWVVLITWPVYLLAIVLASPYLTIFGAGYEGATQVITILAFAMLFATTCGMVDIVLIMAGRTTWTLANSVVALMVMIGIDLVLIPGWGIAGAAVGWSAAIVTNNVLPLAQTIFSLQLHPFGAALGLAMILAGTCFGAVPLVARWVSGAAPGWPLMAIIAGATGYTIGCLRLQRSLSLDGLGDLWQRRRTRPGSPIGERSGGDRTRDAACD